MPERSDTREVKGFDDSRVDSKHWKRLPKRGQKVTLPLRADRGPGQRINLTQRARTSHKRDAIFTIADDHVFLSDSRPGAGEKNDDFEGVFRPQQIALWQRSTDLPSLPKKPGPLALRPGHHNGFPRTGAYTQDRAHPNAYSESPSIIFGPGGGDPFSALPSDLPKAFLEERLHTSKFMRTCVPINFLGITVSLSVHIGQILKPLTTSKSREFWLKWSQEAPRVETTANHGLWISCLR
jgi:hypothetical protein